VIAETQALGRVNGNHADGVESARLVGLRYVVDDRPGITRRRVAGGFTYWDAKGRRVRKAATLSRIRALVIPPAWKHVWICPDPNGHLQATGRDARGRKQYRYHPRWVTVRDEQKFHRLIAFARALPVIRRRTTVDMKAAALSRARVLATVVKLLEKTLIRVGNEEYARTNGSFGLTTMQDRHARVTRNRVRFRFRGKSGVFQNVELDDPQLARSVRRCQELPGQTLFQYVDAEGTRQVLDSADVNAYLHEIAGAEFTAKDFRTWAGTVLAAIALAELEQVASPTAQKKNLVRAVETVALRLGNTKAVCRKCYVHPAIVDAYLDGATIDVVRSRAVRLLGDHGARLSQEERAVLALLKRRLTRARGAGRGPSARPSPATRRAARASAAAR
jgi:DNA topoisomerase I